jgi:hypothetical protein
LSDRRERGDQRNGADQQPYPLRFLEGLAVSMWPRRVSEWYASAYLHGWSKRSHRPLVIASSDDGGGCRGRVSSASGLTLENRL